MTFVQRPPRISRTDDCREITEIYEEMDSLLCHEELFTSPPSNCCSPQMEPARRTGVNSVYATREDGEHVLQVCLQKESSYLPSAGYMEQLRSSDLLNARFRAVNWFIKSRHRLNLSFATVFVAVNYLDRYISINNCKQWQYKRIEKLSVACLSIAAKSDEIFIPSLLELQMKDLDHSFQSSKIQRMELKVLKSLGWRLRCVTAYSYVDLLAWRLDCLHQRLHGALTARITELLLGTLTDHKFIEFRPSTVAVSALKCALEELLPSKSETHLSEIAHLIPRDRTEEINMCHKSMEERVADPLYSLIASGNFYCPPSPVTVIGIFDCYLDFAFSESANPKKRKGENMENSTKNKIACSDLVFA